MDEIRRALVLGVPTAASLGLAGCQADSADSTVGASAGTEVADLAANERAFAQGLASGNALVIASATDQPLGAFFNAEAGLGSNRFRPNLQRVVGCLKGRGARLDLRLHETITRADGTCVYRTLALALSSTTAFRLSPRVSLSKAGAVSGRFMVHGDDEQINGLYEVGSAGSIRVIKPLFTTFYTVQFDAVQLVRTPGVDAITLQGTLPVRYVTEEEPYPYS